MNWTTNRRGSAAALAATAVLMVACGGTAPPAAPSDTNPITIGMAIAFSGLVGFGGPDDQAGAQLAVDDANKNGGVLGRKLKIVTEDSQSTGNGIVTAMRNLSSQNINLVVGGTLTAECTAAIGVLQQLSMVEVSTGCQSDALTGAKVNSNFFRIWANGTAAQSAIGSFACSQWKGISRLDFVAVNSVTGQFQTKNLLTSMAKCGVSQGTGVFVPADATSTLPYVQQLIAKKGSDSTNNSVLAMALTGATGTDLVKVGMPLGLFSNYRGALDLSPTYNQYVDALQPNVPLVYYGNDWDSTEQSAGNTRFVSLYKAAHPGKAISTNAADGYNGMLAYIAAIKKANSTDTTKVATALAGLSFQGTQKNPYKLDAKTHQGNADQVVIEYAPSKPLKVVATIAYADTLGLPG